MVSGSRWRHFLLRSSSSTPDSQAWAKRSTAEAERDSEGMGLGGVCRWLERRRQAVWWRGDAARSGVQGWAPRKRSVGVWYIMGRVAILLSVPGCCISSILTRAVNRPLKPELRGHPRVRGLDEERLHRSRPRRSHSPAPSSSAQPRRRPRRIQSPSHLSTSCRLHIFDLDRKAQMLLFRLAGLRHIVRSAEHSAIPFHVNITSVSSLFFQRGVQYCDHYE